VLAEVQVIIDEQFAKISPGEERVPAPHEVSSDLDPGVS
jgi:hypothetical protein